jgi:hypothetical protein
LSKTSAWIVAVRRRSFNAAGARNDRQLRSEAQYCIENFPSNVVG